VASLVNIRVLFFAMDESPEPNLAEIAMRRGWPFLQMSNTSQAIVELRRRSPSAVVVQVSLPLSEDLELLHRVRDNFSTVTLIAVATTHDDDVERAVRSAGVSLYLPSARDADRIERAIDQVLHHRAPPTAGVTQENDASRRRNQVLSSSASFPPPS
jgi:DNA-binding NarL/FixJ family response regulator